MGIRAQRAAAEIRAGRIECTFARQYSSPEKGDPGCERRPARCKRADEAMWTR